MMYIIFIDLQNLYAIVREKYIDRQSLYVLTQLEKSEEPKIESRYREYVCENRDFNKKLTIGFETKHEFYGYTQYKDFFLKDVNNL